MLLAHSLYCLINKKRGIWYISLHTFGLYQHQSCLSLASYILFLSVCIMTLCGTSFYYGTLLILFSMLLISVIKSYYVSCLPNSLSLSLHLYEIHLVFSSGLLHFFGLHLLFIHQSLYLRSSCQIHSFY